MTTETISGELGRVEITIAGPLTAMAWFPVGNRHPVELARFDSDDKILSIFPHVPAEDGFNYQFPQVREIQLTIATFTWDADSPVDLGDGGEIVLQNLPKGFGTIFRYGLGLPRAYRGLIHSIEAISPCTVVRFDSGISGGEENGIFHWPLERFVLYRKEVDRNKTRGATAVMRVNLAVAQNAVADVVGHPRVQPTVGRNPVIQAITRAITDNVPLEAHERVALVARVQAESKRLAVEQPAALGTLREDLELVTLDALIGNFTKALKGKSVGDEALWQRFFRNNIFALKQIFAAPIAYYDQQVTVRPSDSKGAGAQITDFVLFNTLSRSAVLVEIKTPSMALMAAKPYRGRSTAVVYAADRDLSGSISQLQAQMASARVHLDDLIRRTPFAEALDTQSIGGVVVAGTLTSLSSLQKESFLRYRDGFHGIQIITFDEVLERLVALKEVLTSPSQVSS